MSLQTIKMRKENYDNIFLIVSFLLLCIVSSLRAEHIGTDTANYIHKFLVIQATDFSYIFDLVRYEKGYVLLNKVISYISSNSQLIIAATSFITLLLIFIGIKRSSKNKVLSIYLFITLYYYFISFNAIRQYIAIGFILFAYNSIVKRNFIRYLLLILIASSFHQLAIVLLPLYFLYGIKMNLKKIIYISGCFLILLFSFEAVLSFFFSVFPGYAYYQGTDYLEGGGVLTSLISGSILVFGLLVGSRGKADKEFDFLLLVALFSFLVSVMSTQVILFNRLNYFLEIFNIFFIPYIISMVTNKKNRMLYYFIVCSVTLIYCSVRLIEGWHRVTPYSVFVQ